MKRYKEQLITPTSNGKRGDDVQTTMTQCWPEGNETMARDGEELMKATTSNRKREDVQVTMTQC